MAKLTVQVTDDLTLDAGRCEEQETGDGAIRQIHPPETTLFDQLITYLERKLAEDKPTGYPGFDLGREAIAATALCVWWGSYFAVLADPNKPLWPSARQPALSRISDSEMARINIEASAALEQWIEMMRADRDHYLDLMWAAHRHLPISPKRANRDRSLTLLTAATTPEMRDLTTVEASEQARTEAQAHPTRVLANAVIQACWRNGGVIEDIHAGRPPESYPLLQCRITPAERRKLFRTTSQKMAQAILVVSSLLDEDSPWEELVLPFRCMPRLSPHGWSLDRRTSPVQLFGREVARE